MKARLLAAGDLDVKYPVAVTSFNLPVQAFDMVSHF